MYILWCGFLYRPAHKHNVPSVLKEIAHADFSTEDSLGADLTGTKLLYVYVHKYFDWNITIRFVIVKLFCIIILSHIYIAHETNTIWIHVHSIIKH